MDDIYSLKKINKILSLSDGAIRNYEKKGIIDVKRNSENKYREFTLDDIHKMMIVRTLKRFGLSLDEIKELITNKNLDNSIMSLEKQYLIIQDQIKKQEDNSKLLEKCIDMLKRIDNDIDQISYVKRPNFIFFDKQDINYVSEGEYLENYGFLIKSIDDIRFGFIKVSDEELYPLDTCLYRVFKSKPNEKIIDAIKRFYKRDVEYLKEHGYKIKDEVILLKLFNLNEDGGNVEYFEAYYPITK